MLHCPNREEQEHHGAGDELKTGEFIVQPNQPEETKVDQENVAEDYAGAVSERCKAQQVETEAERNAGESDRGGCEPVIPLPATLRPDPSHAEQHAEADEDPQRNKDLVVLEILFSDEELVKPSELHEHRAQRPDEREKVPALG